MSPRSVRPLAAADLAAVASMVADLNAEEGYNRATAPDAAALRTAFLREAPAGKLLVADVAAELAGYVTLHTTYETEFAARGAYLGDLYVRAGHRRQGVGRALIAAAARAVRSDGGSFLWWTALPQNAIGQAFYRAIGATGEPIQAFALTFQGFERLAGEPGG